MISDICGVDAQPEPLLNPKKKVFETIQPVCSLPVITLSSPVVADFGAVSGSCHPGYPGSRLRGPGDQVCPQDSNQGRSLCCQEVQGRFVVIDVVQVHCPAYRDHHDLLLLLKIRCLVLLLVIIDYAKDS